MRASRQYQTRATIAQADGAGSGVSEATAQHEPSRASGRSVSPPRHEDYPLPLGLEDRQHVYSLAQRLCLPEGHDGLA